MSIASRKPNRVTEQEHLDFENVSPVRHGLIGGVIYGMIGGTDRHNLNCGKVFAELCAAVSAPCQIFTAQTKLRVEIGDEIDFYYPDVSVSHGKFLSYQQIPSVQEYVLVAQDVPQIEIMRRRASWKPEFVLLEDTLAFESVNLTIPARNIYRDIPF